MLAARPRSSLFKSNSLASCEGFAFAALRTQYAHFSRVSIHSNAYISLYILSFATHAKKRTLGGDVWRRDCHCVFATFWQTLCCPCGSCDFHVDFQLSDTFKTYLKVFFRFFSRFIAYYGENIFLGWIPRPVPDLFQDCPLSSFRKRQCHMAFIRRHSQETSTSTNPYYGFTAFLLECVLKILRLVVFCGCQFGAQQGQCARR